VKNNNKNILLSVSSIEGRVYHLKKSDGKIVLFEQDEKEKLIKTKKELKVDNCINFRESEDQLSYFSISKEESGYLGILGFGTNFYTGGSHDGFNWHLDVKLEKFVRSAYIVPNYTYDDKNVLYWSDEDIHIGVKESDKWVLYDDPIYSPLVRANSIYILNVFSGRDEIYVPYTVETQIEEIKFFSLSLAIFDKNDPKKIKWRINYPLFNIPLEFSDSILSPISVVEKDGKIYSFWQGEGKVYKFHHPLLEQIIFESPKKSPTLKKADQNPILSPDPGSDWESVGVFNPAALYDPDERKLHIMYRAVGNSWRSVMGYANSTDGVTIDTKGDYPCYVPRAPFEGQHLPYNPFSPYTSGPGAGGCEDPRLTRIKDKVYLTYVAYDGWSSPRAALSHISYDDFKNNNWNWSYPVIISKPGVIDKNAVIFPEKVNGKYVIMHRIFPDILIDYVDTLDFDGETFLEGKYKIPPRLNSWDSRKVGAGPPPIKTKHGWLLIYHAVDEKRGHQYQMGAMLLNLSDPTKVISRTSQPIASPTHWYENEGFKSGVVYPCGAAVIDENLHVYYGGADTYVCVATTPYRKFLDHLLMEKETKFNYYRLN